MGARNVARSDLGVSLCEGVPFARRYHKKKSPDLLFSATVSVFVFAFVFDYRTGSSTSTHYPVSFESSLSCHK